MQHYHASISFSGEHEHEVLVSSSRCRYHVRVGEEILLLGPGVHESSDATWPELEIEDLAILAVLLFENGLWPEEGSEYATISN